MPINIQQNSQRQINTKKSVIFLYTDKYIKKKTLREMVGINLSLKISWNKSKKEKENLYNGTLIVLKKKLKKKSGHVNTCYDHGLVGQIL